MRVITGEMAHSAKLLGIPKEYADILGATPAYIPVVFILEAQEELGFVWVSQVTMLKEPTISVKVLSS